MAEQDYIAERLDALDRFLRDEKRRKAAVAMTVRAVAGAFVGALIWWLWAREDRYLLAALVGALVAALFPLLSRWLPGAGRSLDVQTATLTVPILGSATFRMTDCHREVGWKVFVEAVTRVAVQDLGRQDGLLREALESLQTFFTLARNELKTLAPTLSTGKKSSATVEMYVLMMLNQGLRPFLSRWHPRLKQWEMQELPEASWPLAALCRQDLLATQTRMLTFTRGLGRILRVPQLNKLLPDSEAEELPPLATDEEIAAAEEAMLATKAPPQ